MSDTLDLAGCHPGFAAGVRRIVELHRQKTQDYGTPEDMLHNLRSSTEWGIEPWVGMMNRASDKVRRLQTFVRAGRLANESVLDSLEDLAAYALLARAPYLDEDVHDGGGCT